MPMENIQSAITVNLEKITVPDFLKCGFIKSLCLFEGISLTDTQAEELLNKDDSIMASFSDDDALIVRNVTDSFAFLDSTCIAGLNVDLNLFIKLNAVLAREQALYTGCLRNGGCSIPCIGEVPVPDTQNIQEEIDRLNGITPNNYKRRVSSCFVSLARMQPFWDGNKRTAFFLCNIRLIKNHLDLLMLTEDIYADFEKHLTAFYTGKNNLIIDFLAEKCFVKMPGA